MTLEEAGQRLLEGEPWVVCPHCDGGSYEPGSIAQTAVGDPNHPGVYMTNTPCSVCKGFSTTLDPLYEQACLLLDRGIPVRTLDFRAKEEIGMSVANSGAVKQLWFSAGTTTGPKGATK